MDIRKIKTLIDMLENSNLNEIEVSQGDESVRISKSNGNIDIEKTNHNQVTDTKANGVKWGKKNLLHNIQFVKNEFSLQA